MTNDPMLIGYAIIILTVGLNIYTQFVNVRKPIEKLNTSSEVIKTNLDNLREEISKINTQHGKDKEDIEREIQQLKMQLQTLELKVAKLEK